jgi:hypothetical protein
MNAAVLSLPIRVSIFPYIAENEKTYFTFNEKYRIIGHLKISLFIAKNTRPKTPTYSLQPTYSQAFLNP